MILSNKALTTINNTCKINHLNLKSDKSRKNVNFAFKVENSDLIIPESFEECVSQASASLKATLIQRKQSKKSKNIKRRKLAIEIPLLNISTSSYIYLINELISSLNEKLTTTPTLITFDTNLNQLINDTFDTQLKCYHIDDIDFSKFNTTPNLKAKDLSSTLILFCPKSDDFVKIKNIFDNNYWKGQFTILINSKYLINI